MGVGNNGGLVWPLQWAKGKTEGGTLLSEDIKENFGFAVDVGGIGLTAFSSMSSSCEVSSLGRKAFGSSGNGSSDNFDASNNFEFDMESSDDSLPLPELLLKQRLLSDIVSR